MITRPPHHRTHQHSHRAVAGVSTASRAPSTSASPAVLMFRPDPAVAFASTRRRRSRAPRSPLAATFAARLQQQAQLAQRCRHQHTRIVSSTNFPCRALERASRCFRRRGVALTSGSSSHSRHRRRSTQVWLPQVRALAATTALITVALANQLLTLALAVHQLPIAIPLCSTPRRHRRPLIAARYIEWHECRSAVSFGNLTPVSRTCSWHTATLVATAAAHAALTLRAKLTLEPTAASTPLLAAVDGYR